MLVLTRREEQDIIINLPDGQRGTIRITEIRCDRVKIGLDFPPAYNIVRGEIAGPNPVKGGA